MSSAVRQAPRAPGQPSRKGKRAWRKNVDIANVTDGLQAARDDELLTGVRGQALADAPADSLFQTDTAGSDDIRRQVRRLHGAPLKADEIIAQRSKVPAVGTRKRSGDGDNQKTTDGVLVKRQRTGSGVHPNELARLRRVAYAGDGQGEVAITGSAAATHDPWADEATTTQETNQDTSFLDKPKPVRAPRTMKEAPRSLTASGRPTPNVQLPHAGRSYNPLFEDWETLLAREGERELAEEKRRLARAEDEAERLERVARIAEQDDDDDDDEANASAYESEWEGITSDADEAQLKSRRPQRKTPAERNKAKRRVEAARLAKHEARTAAREEQARRIDELRRAVEDKEKARAEQKVTEDQQQEADSDDEARLRRGAAVATRVPARNLELVLPDELADSLRRLRPEGNLLRDRYRTAVVQGRVEARRPLSQQRRARRKATEKWTHKDWRLPSAGPRTVA